MRNYKKKDEFDVKVLGDRRITKVTKGAKKLRQSVVVAVGNRKGKIGIASAKASDFRYAIEKATAKAKRNMITVSLLGDTIPHEIEVKFKASRILLRPAKLGTGVIAGSAVRTILELAGITNVYGKQLGTNNPYVNAECTLMALKMLDKNRVIHKLDKMRERDLVGRSTKAKDSKVELQVEDKLIMDKNLSKDKSKDSKEVTK